MIRKSYLLLNERAASRRRGGRSENEHELRLRYERIMIESQKIFDDDDECGPTTEDEWPSEGGKKSFHTHVT